MQYTNFSQPLDLRKITVPTLLHFYNTVVPLFSRHYWFQASVPTLGVSPHQGDRHSGMGGGAVGGLCLCV